MRHAACALVALALFVAAVPASARTCPAGNPRVAPDSRFQAAEPVAGQFVVTDLDTGLVWKRCREGQSGSACTSGSVATMNWGQALSVASAASYAGFNDWRVPNDIEFQSLLESGCYSPALNDTMFPNAMAVTTVVWSSTTVGVGPASAWVTDYDDGYSYNAGKSSSNAVWLVRAGTGLVTFQSETAHGTGTVVFDALAFTYDGAAKALTAHIQEEPATQCSVTPASIGPNAGSFPVTAACNGIHFSASGAATATIAKAVGTVTFGALNLTYNGTAQAVTAVITEEPATNCVVPQSPIGPNTGSYAVTATCNGTNYTASDSATATIAKAVGTIQFSALHFLYNGATKPISATVAEEPTPVCPVFPSTLGPNAGSYLVTAATCESANYVASGITATALIFKASSTVDFGPLNFRYDGSAKTITAHIHDEPDTSCTVTPPSIGPDVGSAAVTAVCDGTNYTATGSTTATVLKAMSTVDFGTLAFTYDGSVKTVTARIHDEPGTSCGVMPSSIGPGAGSTVVTANCNGTNYFAGGSATAVIGKAVSIADFGQLDFTYDGSIKTVTARIHDEPGTSCTITPSSVGPNAGSTPLTATCSGANYTASGSATATIAKATSTVDFGTLNFTYDGSAKTITAHVHDEPSTSCNVTPSSVGPNAGSTPLTATCSGTNYTASGNATANIAMAATTLALSSNCMHTFVEGQPYTIAATLNGGINVTGGANFKDGQNTLCSNLPFANGAATCLTTLSAHGQAVARLALGAGYDGDTNNAPSQATSFTVTALGLAEAIFRNGFDRADPDACPVE